MVMVSRLANDRTRGVTWTGCAPAELVSERRHRSGRPPCQCSSSTNPVAHFDTSSMHSRFLLQMFARWGFFPLPWCDTTGRDFGSIISWAALPQALLNSARRTLIATNVP